MDLFYKLTDLFNHIDDKLALFMSQYGMWAYIILFGIIFAETGLVICPFLPGDGLLFAIGIFSHSIESGISLPILILLLIFAAVLGNTANYHIAKYLGTKVLQKKYNSKLHSQMQKTHELFDKYGGWALVLARFIPFARTFAPFVAGMGQMSYTKFQIYNVVGGIFWVCTCTLLGYFVGESAKAHNHFLTIMILIIIVSIMPILIKFIQHKINLRKQNLKIDKF